ncbi:LOG family protein [Paeniglutamicibacter psychrophenolicus]|uniref:Rossmann-fold nucleotide-binding protein n=1 Tax=Paeniglutamicibacter psychrophenolicus TaxID=257454 RepID=A0ABS4WJD7_9MICC|nr:LOG family protein [Paeniglutamicibacter psychrophenolicus]MBP2376322.1 putative Rossmann-fold nucleotide-binding protein [Paeniglutamicibacter psychrophenolicus]
MNSTPALHPLPRVIEIASLGDFDRHAATALALTDKRLAASMHGWHVQSVDLRARSAVLEKLRSAGSVFMGCEIEGKIERRLRGGGALVFPEIPGLPFDPYRGELYSGGELYAGLGNGSYESVPDARIYAWASHRYGAGAHDALNAALSTTLHDHAIGSRLDSQIRDGALAHAPLVGVMGGHAQQRGSAGYERAARLGHALSGAGFIVATGGGPGAMEAANLGAYLGSGSTENLAEALGMLAQEPGFAPSVTRWARAADRVRERWPVGLANLGIPTWFYGHEPPNMFATHIAKYFANATREAVLLEKCSGGIVFLPGAAGTVQEIFQDACENYYGAEGSISPMVLVGIEHWTRTLPAYPLLAELARGRAMEEKIFLVEDAAEAVRILVELNDGSISGVRGLA